MLNNEVYFNNIFLKMKGYKMKFRCKNLIVGTSLILVSSLFTGCFNQENKCNSVDNNELIQSILIDNPDKIEDQVLLKLHKKLMAEENSKKSDNPYVAMAMQGAQMDNFMLMAVSLIKEKEGTPHNEKAKAVRSELATVATNMHDYFTISKDAELDKVECKAIIDYKFTFGVESFTLVYTSQPSDDGENLYVEISTIESVK